MIEHSSARTVTVAFEGELDARGSDQFRDAIIEAATADIDTVILDLGGVTFFDSSAIRALLGARTHLAAGGVIICIDPCSSIVQRVMDITGLREHFPLAPPLADAPITAVFPP